MAYILHITAADFFSRYNFGEVLHVRASWANYDQKVIMHVDWSMYNKECSPFLIIQVGGGGGVLILSSNI